MRRINVKKGTICPLCPDHHDDEFVWSDIVQEPICIGCSYEIYYGLEFERQPTLEEYNCSLTIERLLVHCNISFEIARRRHFAEIISSLHDKLQLVTLMNESGRGIAETIENLHKEINAAMAVMQNSCTNESEMPLL